MSAFAIDGDTIIALIATLCAGFALVQAMQSLRGRANARAVLWCAAAIITGLVALFFATFQIRLM